MHDSLWRFVKVVSIINHAYPSEPIPKATKAFLQSKTNHPTLRPENRTAQHSTAQERRRAGGEAYRPRTRPAAQGEQQQQNPGTSRLTPLVPWPWTDSRQTSRRYK